MEAQSLSLSVAFAAGILSFLSPCVLPLVPAYISHLGVASQSETVASGARLLVAYSAGLAVPFLLTALLLDPMMRALRGVYRYMWVVTALNGLFLIVVGVLMLTNMFVVLPQYFDWGY